MFIHGSIHVHMKAIQYKSNGRVVMPELLDSLPPGDRLALRSRLDLRRLNQWMNHSRLMARALAKNLNATGPHRVVELGAGDGHFLLSVARRLKCLWPEVEVTLVDRQDTFDPEIRASYDRLGWRIRIETTDAFEWLRKLPPNSAHAITCNLFLHHFQGQELDELLQLAARSARVFVALEPRRSWLPRLCGHLLWVIRCNSVTRHDAGISIRAGFSGSELSAIWPDKGNWHLTERSAGLFSHMFMARRKD
jgi:hypothetical protein